ncbi:MAG: hypothetical protein ABJK43_05025 [Lentilitoribacter sp.]
MSAVAFFLGADCLMRTVSGLLSPISSSRAYSLLHTRHPSWGYVLLVSVVAFVFLLVKEMGADSIKLWDYRVYLKAKETFLETGSPYFERESLRFIYPPSATALFPFVSASPTYQSWYFIVMGVIWFSSVALFCRKNIHALVVFPVFFYVFGGNGYVTILTGNIAPLLYFSAALAGYLHLSGKTSTVVFSAFILGLTLIKPFYAEFLIFVWFLSGIRTFLISAAGVIGLFFAINIAIYPELFPEFLLVLKLNQHDTEIFGITLLSHFAFLNVPVEIAGIVHFALIGTLFFLCLQRQDSFTDHQWFCCLFILAVLINPKHLTYDLMIIVPALVVLLLESKMLTLTVGCFLLFVSSFFSFGLSEQPYFQWWYGAVFSFLIVLLSRKISNGFRQTIAVMWHPTHLSQRWGTRR